MMPKQKLTQESNLDRGPARTPGHSASETGLSAAERASINILIVDDEPRNLTVLETVLDDPGYRVVRAGSADQALLALISEEFALIILDVQMPGMSGFELAQTIKERKKTAHVPIIFLTAHYHEDQHVMEGYSTGAVDYLHKPLNPTVLKSKVSVFAELHRKNCALAAEVAERRRMEELLSELNHTLEQRVAERTDELRDRNEELLRVNAQLKQSNVELDAFAYIASHDLKEPLRGIHNYAAIVRRMAATRLAEAEDGRLATILALTKRMDELIEGLLQYSLVGRVDLALQPMNLHEVVSGCVEMFRSRIDESGATVRVRPLPTVLCDRVRISGVISNLLLNALKYNDNARKEIEIGWQDAPQPVFYVRDNGIGIPSEHREDIFQIFRRLHGRDEYGGGTGAGLTIARKTVERHGGRMWVESEPGQGSTFYFTLAAERASPLETAR